MQNTFCYTLIWSSIYSLCDLRCKVVDTRRRNGCLGMRSSTDFWKRLRGWVHPIYFYGDSSEKLYRLQQFNSIWRSSFSKRSPNKIFVKLEPDFPKRKSSGSITMWPHHTTSIRTNYDTKQRKPIMPKLQQPEQTRQRSPTQSSTASLPVSGPWEAWRTSFSPDDSWRRGSFTRSRQSQQRVRPQAREQVWDGVQRRTTSSRGWLTTRRWLIIWWQIKEAATRVETSTLATKRTKRPKEITGNFSLFLFSVTFMFTENVIFVFSMNFWACHGHDVIFSEQYVFEANNERKNNFKHVFSFIFQIQSLSWARGRWEPWTSSQPTSA